MYHFPEKLKNASNRWDRTNKKHTLFWWEIRESEISWNFWKGDFSHWFINQAIFIKLKHSNKFKQINEFQNIQKTKNLFFTIISDLGNVAVEYKGKPHHDLSWESKRFNLKIDYLFAPNMDQNVEKVIYRCPSLFTGVMFLLNLKPWMPKLLF